MFLRDLIHKIPYLYEDNLHYEERGIKNAPDYLDQPDLNPDLARIYQAVSLGSDYTSFITSHLPQFSPHTLILNDQINKSPNPQINKSPNLIIPLTPFNNIRHLNDFLLSSSLTLPIGGTIALHGETSGMRRHRIRTSHTRIIGRIIELLDYLWRRVCSKLTLTRRLYMLVTHNRDRSFPRVEILGRIARAGFDICGDEIIDGTYYVTAIKRRDPITTPPHYGIFVRLPRKGQNGKNIGVFKLRTMYAYSEYIQDYTYRINGLETGGKLKDDFRVNTVGRFCRSRFLDELPMLLNWIRGDLKLVGVRPISAHYLSLYTPEMQALHLSVKPGIFPPLYYEYPKPKDLPEIQASERRYITSYLLHPHRTDLRYLLGMLRNITLRHSRSH